MRVQGHVLDMLRDCNTGIRWVLNHAHQHGGDPSNIFLVGQSCGAQLAALACITQAGSSRPLGLLTLPAYRLPGVMPCSALQGDLSHVHGTSIRNAQAALRSNISDEMCAVPT